MTIHPLERVLDRLPPPDWEHVARYALSAIPRAEQPKGVPVVFGVNWYNEFDYPEKDSSSRYWIAKNGKLTGVRGGHCLCAKAGQRDPSTWWTYYNQGNE